MKLAKILLILVSAYLVGCSDGSDLPTQAEQIKEKVTILSEVDCSGANYTATCYEVEVIANGISARKVLIKAYTQQNSKGAMILTAGGYGGAYYADAFGSEGVNTIKTLYLSGLEVYDVKWGGERGWGTNAEGYGYPKAVGGYSTIVKWLHNKVIDNPERIFAHGNSGGSFQVAFGLALYGLDEYLDIVILSGGPPVADLKRGIFGELTDDTRWPDGLAGLEMTDYIMGWEAEQYCKDRYNTIHLPNFNDIKNKLDEVSLVSSSEFRKLDYTTIIHFVQSDDETNADHQAQIYYDAITSNEKYWHSITSTTEHKVPSTTEGAETIRQIILGEI